MIASILNILKLIFAGAPFRRVLASNQSVQCRRPEGVPSAGLKSPAHESFSVGTLAASGTRVEFLARST
jgi:hypothetical protein